MKTSVLERLVTLKRPIENSPTVQSGIQGKVAKKWEKHGLLPNRGGSARVVKNKTTFFKSIFRVSMQNHSTTAEEPLV